MCLGDSIRQTKVQGQTKNSSTEKKSKNTTNSPRDWNPIKIYKLQLITVSNKANENQLFIPGVINRALLEENTNKQKELRKAIENCTLFMS